MRLWPSLLLAGCLAESHAPPAAPANPAEAAAKHWRIYGHVMSDHPAVTDDDADALDGRELAIGYAEYESPFHGRCTEAIVAQKQRATGEVAQELNIAKSGLGVGANVLEFRLTCKEANKPALVIYVDGGHAISCWAGVCYLLGA